MIRLILVLSALFPLLGDINFLPLERSEPHFISLREMHFPGTPKQDAVSAITQGDFRFIGFLSWPEWYVPSAEDIWQKKSDLHVVTGMTMCVIWEDQIALRESAIKYAAEYNRMIRGVRYKTTHTLEVPAHNSL